MIIDAVITALTLAGGRLYAAVNAAQDGHLGVVAHSAEVARLAPYRSVDAARFAVEQLGGQSPQVEEA